MRWLLRILAVVLAAILGSASIEPHQSGDVVLYEAADMPAITGATIYDDGGDGHATP